MNKSNGHMVKNLRRNTQSKTALCLYLYKCSTTNPFKKAMKLHSVFIFDQHYEILLVNIHAMSQNAEIEHYLHNAHNDNVFHSFSQIQYLLVTTQA